MPRITKNYDRYALKDLGHHIGGRIKDAGMTQAELAEKIGVTQQTISRWINNTGTVTIEQIQKIAQIIPLNADFVINAIFPWGTKPDA